MFGSRFEETQFNYLCRVGLSIYNLENGETCFDSLQTEKYIGKSILSTTKAEFAVKIGRWKRVGILASMSPVDIRQAYSLGAALEQNGLNVVLLIVDPSIETLFHQQIDKFLEQEDVRIIYLETSLNDTLEILRHFAKLSQWTKRLLISSHIVSSFEFPMNSAVFLNILSPQSITALIKQDLAGDTRRKTRKFPFTSYLVMPFDFIGTEIKWQALSSNALLPRDGPMKLYLNDKVSDKVQAFIITLSVIFGLGHCLVWLSPWLLRLQGRKQTRMILTGSLLVPGCIFLDIVAVLFTLDFDNDSLGICYWQLFLSVLGYSLLHSISTFKLALSARKTHRAWMFAAYCSQVCYI